MKTLILLATLSTPPLSFISIDCTQYGSPTTPFLIMSHRGIGATLPVSVLNQYPQALRLLNEIESGEHERWIDPKCKWVES
ncbi:hypothetical protein [Sedimenticola hydrogenitrophicus]|uniref:hypothetical protein n=1 Tax=Sedimenticola hydrogenitrophicus TaxID=2967975 RepID=UPI0021A77AF5|nr:hypothetical protein [Sedimenticola hydrogenitrophicus]